MNNQCKLCKTEFSPRNAGKKQIFCSAKCRKMFEKQLRTWALVQEENGNVDLETLALKRGNRW